MGGSNKRTERAYISGSERRHLSFARVGKETRATTRKETVVVLESSRVGLGMALAGRAQRMGSPFILPAYFRFWLEVESKREVKLTYNARACSGVAFHPSFMLLFPKIQ